MKDLIDLINANASIDRYPEFKYYLPWIEEAVENLDKHPDRTIENCKSLLEGVSKSLILRFDSKVNRARVERTPAETVIKQAVEQLSKQESDFEALKKHFEELTKCLTTIRNKRGDVSHGKATPKIDNSDQYLARFLIRQTEACLIYMLQILFDQPTILRPSTLSYEPLDYNAKKLDRFNELLDDLHPDFSLGRYSKALYELDYDQYVAEHETYIVSTLDDDTEDID